MIFYLTILIAFLWLGVETRWLTIRLPYGALQCPRKPIKAVSGSEPPATPIQPLLLTEQCRLTEIYGVLGKHATNTHWSPGGYDTKEKPSYQQMLIGGSTVTLKATLPNLHKRIADLRKAADSKPSQRVTYAQLPMSIELVQTGSHQEPFTWVAHDGQEYKSTNTVFDYKPIFHDCLVPKTWLKKHYKDVIPEPAMELIVDGKTLSVNGNYKSSLVKDFIKAGKRSYS